MNNIASGVTGLEPMSNEEILASTERYKKQKESEIKDLIKIAKDEGLKSLEIHGIKFEFWDRPAPAPAETTQDSIPLKGDEMPSDEEMLMWSTDTYDQMQENLEDKTPE